MIKTRLIKLLSNAGRYILWQIFWQWTALVSQIVIIYFVSMLLESALYGEAGQGMALNCAGFIASGILIRYISDRMGSRASYQASADVKRVLRERIYEKLLKLGTAYRSRISTAEAVQMSAEGVEQLEVYFGRYLPQLVYAMLAPLTLFAVLSNVNLRAGLVLLAAVPLIPVSIVAVQKIAKRLLSKYWGVYTGLGDSFLENLQGLTTLKIYRADEERADFMDSEAERFRRITMKVLMMQLNSISVMDIVAYGGAALGMAVVLKELGAGRVGISGALMIILLASEFFIPMRILGSFFHIAMNGMAASDKIFAFLDLPVDDTAKEDIEKAGIIRFKDVSFSYAGRDEDSEEAEVLRGLNMLIFPGSLVALAGRSGCGKSTAAGILSGKNRGYKGSIEIDGKELSDISPEALMRNITRLGHDSYIFKGTVRENLLMGNENASDEELWSALDKVKLKGFLENQKGLDTQLQEKGANFSGGQRQRLAFARALLHDTPVYILDEATSNIDVESEGQIMEAVSELSASGRTVLLISHRLANLSGADMIYMLGGGSISEQGKHEDLINSGGEYAKLFKSQQILENYGRDKGFYEEAGSMGKEAS